MDRGIHGVNLPRAVPQQTDLALASGPTLAPAIAFTHPFVSVTRRRRESNCRHTRQQNFMVAR